MPLLPILDPVQAAEWDARAERAGLALATLMESAGRAVALAALRSWPAATRGGVLVAAGTGHNGGDGWVAARALHQLGVPVWVTELPGEAAPLTSLVRTLARAAGVREVGAEGPWPAPALVIDAILGTGARGAPRPAAQALLDRLLDLPVPVLAVDGPTGVDLATGLVHGAPRADLTVTFGGLRRGHLLARDECGDVLVADIGHPPPDAAWPALVTDGPAAAWFPPFRADEHKGTRGRVVVLGGDAAMSGAARLAGRAAFAAGAGLVHVVAPADAVAAIRAAEPDLQTHVQPLDAALDDGTRDLLARADAVVIGPGLGRAPGRTALVLDAMTASRRVVLDADALVAVAGRLDAVRELARERACVLTPHPGEFRQLFPELAALRDTDPWGAAAQGAERVGATLLLKGVPSVVASERQRPLTVASGNPGLATGGSGDVLGGIAGALLARAAAPHESAAAAAHALGRAAELAARRATARSLRPMDVLAALPDLWREWDAIARLGARVDAPFLLHLRRPQVT